MSDLRPESDETYFLWPQVAAPPLDRARLRTTPEDFVVEEVMGFPLSGEGEHVWLWVEKRGHNTERVARLLARHCGVAPSAVRFGGLKDRNAVTRQYFSVHLLRGPEPEPGEVVEGVTILDATRHTRSLRRGAGEANRFKIVLRDCVGERDAVAGRLELIARKGLPNYFGPQRFGRGGENIERARAMFAGERIRDRHLRGIYLSAARSFLFNEVLAERIRTDRWDHPRLGDVFVLDGTNSFFVPDAIDDEIEMRLAQHDIHISAPLWGAGAPIARGEVAAWEQSIVDAHADLASGLAAADLRQERRAVRVVPHDLAHIWCDESTLEISFKLPGGCYATAVTAALVREIS